MNETIIPVTNIPPASAVDSKRVEDVLNVRQKIPEGVRVEHDTGLNGYQEDQAVDDLDPVLHEQEDIPQEVAEMLENELGDEADERYM
jgi:hypothetical protein